MDIALNYEAQAALEERMLDNGKQRYHNNAAFAADTGNLTRSEGTLFNKAYPDVLAAVQASYVEESASGGRKSSHYEAMEMVAHEDLAAFALKSAFEAAASELPLTGLAIRIGKMVSIAVALEIIKLRDSAEYKKLTGRKAATEKGRLERAEQALEAADMGTSDDEYFKIGSPFIRILQASTNLFVVPDQEVKESVIIEFTEEAQAELERTMEIQQWMTPVYSLMTTAPNPWTDYNTGAYNDVRVAKTVPIMHTYNRETQKQVAAAVTEQRPFVKALNAIQAVPLQINQKVLEVLEYVFEHGIAVGKVPGLPKKVDKAAEKGIKRGLYADNKKTRAKRNAIKSAIAEAKLYAGQPFFQPASLDWRGRVYAKPGFNHQRADYCKGLFEFANGCVLNETGVWKLKWHVATTAGKVNGISLDKLPNNERVEWTEANLDMVKAIAADPIASLDLWKTMDSPFCFLAACVDLQGYLDDPKGHVSHTPCADDGSCSGLQHYSALLRDPEGGSHVNLIPMDKPQDVYAAVAAIVKPLVERDAAEGEVAAVQWLQHGIDRKVAKRATMTFVYGSKMRGFSKQLETDLVDTEKGREIFGTEWEAQSVACNYMAKHIDTAVKQTVKAAAEGMSWLQQVSTIMGGQDLPVRWTTPLGLPVTNAYFKKETTMVNALLWDRALNVPTRFRAKVAVGNTKTMDRSKQRNGVAPNFVHSMDASHLMSVVLKASDEGINDFLLIHDSFASLPNDSGRFGEIIREAFVGLYAENEPLEEIMHSAIEDLMVKFEAADADDQADITKALKKLRKLGMPSKGTLDLNGVLKSQYAFA